MLSPAHREMAEEHLAQAEDACVKGRAHVNQQEAIVAKLPVGGRARASAEALLAVFRESQALHEDHRDRLRYELGLTRKK
jgi:hypothetical protein